MVSPGRGARASRAVSRVMNGCGASTQKRWPYGHADGFLRHHSAAASTQPAASAAPRRPPATASVRGKDHVGGLHHRGAVADSRLRALSVMRTTLAPYLSPM